MGDSIISVYQDYQMDPGFYRLRNEGANFIAGGGRLDAPVLFVADAPASAFRVANLLLANDFTLEQCYVTSLIKYESERLPMPNEVRDSRPYLRREMAMLDPKVICPLGPHALGSFIRDAPSWNLAVGRVFATPAGTPVVPVQIKADFAVALKCLEDKEFQSHGRVR